MRMIGFPCSIDVYSRLKDEGVVGGERGERGRRGEEEEGRGRGQGTYRIIKAVLSFGN